MIFEIIRGGKKLTGWGKNGPAYFFPGERMGRPILSPGKKLTGGKFRPVTPVLDFHEIWSTYYNHMWSFSMLKLYLDKEWNMLQFDGIQNIQLKYWDTVT